MDLIKLLDVANPKKIKDTLNILIENYEDFGDRVQAIADKAAKDSAAALVVSNEAKETAQENTVSLEQSIAAQNTQITEAITAQNTALTEAITAQDLKLDDAIAAQDALVSQSAEDSANAKQTAEEALAMIEQADARSEEATALAEQAIATADEATATSELAMNVATEAKSTVDQAISTGVFGTFVHNSAGISLLHAYMTDDINAEDTDERFHVATPKLVREALKSIDLSDYVDLTSAQTIPGVKSFDELVLNTNSWGCMGISNKALNNTTTTWMRRTLFGYGVSGSHDATVFGYNAEGTYQGTAFGSSANAKDDHSTAVGYNTYAAGYGSVAIGSSARTSAQRAIQLGQGTNSTAQTLQVYTYTLLDGTTGLIPNERINSTDLLAEYYTKSENDSILNTALENKVDKVEGKGLSTNDYTTEEKTKLAGLENYDDTNLSSKVSTIETKISEQDTSINQKLPLSGGTMTGAINMGGNYIRGTEGFISNSNTFLLAHTTTGKINVGNAEEELWLYGNADSCYYNGYALAKKNEIPDISNLVTLDTEQTLVAPKNVSLTETSYQDGLGNRTSSFTEESYVKGSDVDSYQKRTYKNTWSGYEISNIVTEDQLGIDILTKNTYGGGTGKNNAQLSFYSSNGLTVYASRYSSSSDTTASATFKLQSSGATFDVGNTAFKINSSGAFLNDLSLATLSAAYVSGTDGYVIFKVGEKKYMECWGKVAQSFSDNKTYTFTLPNSVTFGNTNWSLQVGATGYTDCAWLNSYVAGNNSFGLCSQRYSNGANSLEVFYKASGFVS